MRLPKVALRIVAAATVAVALLSALACQYKRAAVMDRATGLAELDALYAGRGLPSRLSGDRLDKQKAVAFFAAEELAPAQAAPLSRKMVRNGSLEMVVADVAQASGKIRGIVDGLGGYVENRRR